jgi:ribulose-phosphate 3-epimerase
MALIGPSLMCADLGNLRKSVQSLEAGGVDFYHLDIMDGKFVPNFTFGPDLIKAVRPLTKKPFDVHLMVEEPDQFIDLFGDAGANMISVHIEATKHLQKTLQHIRDRGMKAGLAINPSTPLTELDYVLDVTDYVCLMTVNPGFAGQSFIPSMLVKISDLKRMINASGFDIPIEVDGNISYEIIPKVMERGASMLVCGTSSLFKPNTDLQMQAEKLRSFVQHEQK